MEELKSLQENLDSMEQRLTEMEDKIDSIDEKLTQVVDAILGNPLTKQGGFIAEITNLKDQISYLKGQIEKLEIKQGKYDLFKNRIIWTIGIIVSIGAIAKYIFDVYLTVNK
jgi:prefoldin subunit 5